MFAGTLCLLYLHCVEAVYFHPVSARIYKLFHEIVSPPLLFLIYLFFLVALISGRLLYCSLCINHSVQFAWRLFPKIFHTTIVGYAK